MHNIVVKDLSFFYKENEKLILNNINMDVDEG